MSESTFAKRLVIDWDNNGQPTFTFRYAPGAELLNGRDVKLMERGFKQALKLHQREFMLAQHLKQEKARA